jgi:hypothetical protein
MRSKLHILTLVLFSLFLVQCQKEAGFIGGPDPVIETPLPITAHLQGNVFNENDVPAAGVTIKVGTKTAITDANGYFRILDASLDKRSAVVTAEINGYFKAYRSFAATSGTNHIEIKLIKRNLTGTIDAVAGGEVSIPNGAKVQLAPNGVVVAATGAAYAGTVNVYAAYIDPTSNDIDRTVPGSFMANDATNTRVLLASFGMMAVELSAPTGEKLQVKTGTTAKLTMPIPSSLQSSAPATIPLWYVNDQTGIWQEEGSASKVGGVYVGEVKHFTFWNCDLPNSTIPLNFTLKNAAGEPIVHVHVSIVRAAQPNQGMVHGYTDSLGQGNPLVPANQALIMKIFDPCGNVIYTQNIGPFTQATNLGVITLPNTITGMVTVTGIVNTCAGTPVIHGHVVVVHNNMVRYANINAQGHFSVSFIKCSSSVSTATILGVDATANQQGSLQTITLVQPQTNIGTYSACGVSSQQFMNYTFDGTSFSIQALPGDSLMAYTQQQGTTIANTFISGMNLPSNKKLSFRFNPPTLTAGSYPIKEINVNGHGMANPPISVNITNFPLNVAGFYEGNFSGNFTDSSGTHTISCDFRVRRNF